MDNKRERLCLVSAEGLAHETSLCYGATEHRYRPDRTTHLRAKRFSAPVA